MPATKMVLNVNGIQRGVITDGGQKWAKVHTTELFQNQDDNTMGERSSDVSCSFGFIDQVKAAKVQLPALLECLCNISINKSGAKLTVESFVGVVKPAAAK